ncbi:MAG TPA: hypothetical protein VEO01_40520 [Pseudonocardiaceae bacterium]|nr:hypothetical protein [Pseudonocardiaceae bacterium]
MPASPAAQAAQKFAETYGALVTGAAKTLPATASGDIFLVTGGRVIVTSLTGVVSTIIQAQATTLSVGNKPTGGSSAVATLCATADLNAKPVGTSLAVPQAKASALIVSGADGTLLWNTTSGAQGVPFENGGIALVPAGSIQVTTGATSTGAITWSVTWVPYDAGAVVTAA